MSNDKMMQRVISVTRAFEKKHFGKKTIPSSKLTTKQQAVVDVMKKEDFGCNQQKVINLMSAVMGLPKKCFKEEKKDRIDFEKFLAFVDEGDSICVNLGTNGSEYLLTELSTDGTMKTDSVDYYDTDWRVATNEEIGQFFEELYK